MLVAALGAGGLGAILREIFAGIGKLARGVSLKESGRKDDLVAERDRAIARADHLERERDAENRNRRRTETYAAALLRIIVVNGYTGVLPAEPVIEDTITPAQLRQIKGGSKE